VVESRTCPQPVDLIGRHCVLSSNLEGLAGRLSDLDLDLSIGLALEEIGESESLNSVARADSTIIFLISKPEGKDPLFLRAD